MQTWVNVNYFRDIMLVTFTVATKQDICHGLCYNGLCRKFNIFVSSHISSLVGQTKAYRPISCFARLSQTITLNKNSIIKFDEISVNEGNLSTLEMAYLLLLCLGLTYFPGQL